MSDINAVRERLERAFIDEHGITWMTAKKMRALLADRARLAEELRKVNSGETVSVRFDLSPAAKEGAVRDQLVAMGWTPPDVAPAIDLEKFREAIAYAKSAAVVNTHDELAEMFARLLALIDGQANPNEPKFRDRSTHRVYRGSCGYLPCYCHADADHMIGDEQPSKDEGE